jgi:hypothetical protein
MELINIFGERLSIDAKLWKTVLNVAQAHGWRPQRPGPAAMDLAGSRSELAVDYFAPVGQEVTRADAAALADSLRSAAASELKLQSNLEAIAAYSSRSGFLLCADPPNTSTDLLNLLQATSLGRPDPPMLPSADRTPAAVAENRR